MKAACCPRTREDVSLPSKRRIVKHLPKSPTAAVPCTIAGFDPSSGAGITADLQVFQDHGLEGVSAVTALTVQFYRGMLRVEPVSPTFLQETLNLLRRELAIAGVKIGMLATAGLVEVVAEFLRNAGLPPERVVLDPVIRASSGAQLLEPEGVRRLVEDLLPLAGWVTPNLDEAGTLVGVGVGMVSRDGVPEVARRIQSLASKSGSTPAPSTGSSLNVVVTGGHLDPPDDFLLTAAGEELWIPGSRVESRSRHGTHGTGCVFSSALLCRLLAGDSPVDAVRGAKAAVVRRLLHGSSGQ